MVCVQFLYIITFVLTLGHGLSPEERIDAALTTTIADLMNNDNIHVELPQFYGELYFKIKLYNGLLERLYTAKRVGKVTFDSLSAKSYSFSTNIKFENLKISYNYDISRWIDLIGRLEAEFENTEINLKGIIQKENNTCAVKLQDVMIEEMAGLKLHFQPAGILEKLIRLIFEFLYNNFNMKVIVHQLNANAREAMMNNIPVKPSLNVICIDL